MCNSNEFEYYCQVIMCCVSFCNSYYLLRMKNIQHAHRFFSSFPYYPHFSIYLPWFIGKFSFNAPVSRLQIKAKQILSFESSSNGTTIVLVLYKFNVFDYTFNVTFESDRHITIHTHFCIERKCGSVCHLYA